MSCQRRASSSPIRRPVRASSQASDWDGSGNALRSSRSFSGAINAFSEIGPRRGSLKLPSTRSTLGARIGAHQRSSNAKPKPRQLPFRSSNPAAIRSDFLSKVRRRCSLICFRTCRHQRTWCTGCRTLKRSTSASGIRSSPPSLIPRPHSRERAYWAHSTWSLIASGCCPPKPRGTGPGQQSNGQKNVRAGCLSHRAPALREALRPLISLWLDILVLRLLTEPHPNRRPAWFVIDELPAGSDCHSFIRLSPRTENRIIR